MAIKFFGQGQFFGVGRSTANQHFFKVGLRLRAFYDPLVAIYLIPGLSSVPLLLLLGDILLKNKKNTGVNFLGPYEIWPKSTSIL